MLAVVDAPVEVAQHVLGHRLIVQGMEPYDAVQQALQTAQKLRPVEG